VNSSETAVKEEYGGEQKCWQTVGSEQLLRGQVQSKRLGARPCRSRRRFRSRTGRGGHSLHTPRSGAEVADATRGSVQGSFVQELPADDDLSSVDLGARGVVMTDGGDTWDQPPEAELSSQILGRRILWWTVAW
jgi:hypothetical protein